MIDPAYAVDYERGTATITATTYESYLAVLQDELPTVWRERYDRMCSGVTNVLVVDLAGFTYLFDFSSELTASGELSAVREDRLVAGYGRTTAAGKRPASRIAGFPGSDERGDRGHFIAQASGGGSDINLFHQESRLNRGHSAARREYRAMERYCARHHGTFCFSRPIYGDPTARPTHLEFGLLRLDLTLWVRVFANS